MHGQKLFNTDNKLHEFDSYVHHILLTSYSVVGENRFNATISRFVSPFLLVSEPKGEYIKRRRGSWRGKIYKTEAVAEWIWSQLQRGTQNPLSRAIFASCIRQAVRFLLIPECLTSKAYWAHWNKIGIDMLSVPYLMATTGTWITCMNRYNKTHQIQEISEISDFVPFI